MLIDTQIIVSKNVIYRVWNMVIRSMERMQVAKCIDNLGLEDKFDQGIEYVVAENAGTTTLFVFDKQGVKQEVMSDRFEVREDEEEPRVAVIDIPDQWVVSKIPGGGERSDLCNTLRSSTIGVIEYLSRRNWTFSNIVDHLRKGFDCRCIR